MKDAATRIPRGGVSCVRCFDRRESSRVLMWTHLPVVPPGTGALGAERCESPFSGEPTVSGVIPSNRGVARSIHADTPQFQGTTPETVGSRWGGWWGLRRGLP